MSNIFTMTREGLTETGNQFKEVFLEKMHQEGIIDDNQFKQMLGYSIILSKKKYLGGIWDKLFNKDYDRIVVVKVIDYNDIDDLKTSLITKIVTPNSDKEV